MRTYFRQSILRLFLASGLISALLLTLTPVAQAQYYSVWHGQDQHSFVHDNGSNNPGAYNFWSNASNNSNVDYSNGWGSSYSNWQYPSQVNRYDLFTRQLDRFEEQRDRISNRFESQQQEIRDRLHGIVIEHRHNPDNGGEDDIGDEDNHNDDDYTVPNSCEIDNLDEVKNFPPQNGPIVALGDSLTYGVGASSGQDYVSELERMTGQNIINAGLPGNTTEGALNRLEEDVLDLDPSTVIVFLGGNDILQRYYDDLRDEAEGLGLLDELERIVEDIFGESQYSVDDITEAETFENIERIVERIQDTSAVVILVGIDGEPFDSGLSDRYEEVAEQTGAMFVPDVLDNVIGNPTRMSDLVHPNNRGYDIVAERIYGALSCVTGLED